MPGSLGSVTASSSRLPFKVFHRFTREARRDRWFERQDLKTVLNASELSGHRRAVATELILKTRARDRKRIAVALLMGAVLAGIIFFLQPYIIIVIAYAMLRNGSTLSDIWNPS
jgi:hypothetical protein